MGFLQQSTLTPFSSALSNGLQIGTYVGMSTFVIGFAGLAGTPITGALINKDHGYTGGIIFSASVIMAGAVIITCARYMFAKDKLVA